VGEGLSDLGRTEHADPRRGQLDGQRDPVETPADLPHGVGVRIGEAEGRADLPRPLDEELD
jgi:hypothetical protein